MKKNNNTFNNIKKLIDALEYYAGVRVFSTLDEVLSFLGKLDPVIQKQVEILLNFTGNFIISWP